MALTTAMVVVHAKNRRPPISATTEGSAVATTRSDNAWIATPPVSMPQTAAFPSRKRASQPTAGVLSSVAPVQSAMSFLSASSANTDGPPMNEWPRVSLGRLPSKSFSGIDGIMPERPHLFGVGLHGRLEASPIGRVQINQTEDLEWLIAVAFAQQRLHLEERIAGVKLDRRVCAGQPDVRKERTKPRVGLDDALEMLIPLGSRDVGRPARQQCPLGCGSRQIS